MTRLSGEVFFPSSGSSFETRGKLLQVRINVPGINLPARNRPKIVLNRFSDDFRTILGRV